MGLGECVECEKDLVRGRYFLLASSDRGELEVVEDAPELGSSLGALSDGGDEEVVEFWVECSIIHLSQDDDRSS